MIINDIDNIMMMMMMMIMYEVEKGWVCYKSQCFCPSNMSMILAD